MSGSRLLQTNFKRTSALVPALAFLIILLVAGIGTGQSTPPAQTFRAGQSMYIVAFRLFQYPIFPDPALREAAFGRYLIGPLKLPTVTRLSDRLVKQFQEKVSK